VKRQQAAFVREQFINRFTSGYDLANKDAFPQLEQILIQSGIDFNDSIRRNLEKAGAISSGALADIPAGQVYQNGNQYTLEVGYPLNSKQIEYYDFINKGVQGVGGKNARPKKNSGQYKFKSKFPNRKMAANIFSWLNRSRKSLRAESLDLSKVQKKKRKIAKVLDEATNKKRLAYAISSAIKRDGIKATYYFDRAIQENFGQDFKDSIAEALGGDIILQIRAIYGNNNNGSTSNR
jgi:hypothetical protein